MIVSELKAWIAKQPDEAEVYIDEGGLTLQCDPTNAYIEVGGKPEEDDSDESLLDPHEWLNIANAITETTGLTAKVEGGGAAPPWIEVKLDDGRILTFNDGSKDWSGCVYENTDAFKSYMPMDSVTIDTDLPTTVLSPSLVAKAFKDAITDVCMAGSPAILGRCGDPDCVCAPAETNEHRFTNYYVHCKTEWSDDWSAMCNDECPVCGHEIEPYASTDNDDSSTVLHVGGDFIPEDGWPEGIVHASKLDGWEPCDNCENPIGPNPVKGARLEFCTDKCRAEYHNDHHED